MPYNPPKIYLGEIVDINDLLRKGELRLKYLDSLMILKFKISHGQARSTVFLSVVVVTVDFPYLG